MRILDVRGKDTGHIYKLESQYPARFYRCLSTQTTQETTDADIKEFQKRAEKEGAVALFISNYGQSAYIPVEQPQSLPQTRDGIKNFWVEQNPEGTWAIVEAWPGGAVRSPYRTREEAIKREEDIGKEYELRLKLVPSPKEKFPKQHEALKGLYPYIIAEYHDDGDLTVRELIPLKGRPGFDLGKLYVVTTDGEVFEETSLAMTTLPQMVRDGYFWTAINKGTGEITESTVAYTSAGRALRGGRAFALRHWKGDEALIEVWKQPYRYSESLKIQPVATERLGPGISPQTTFERGTDYYKVPPEAY